MSKELEAFDRVINVFPFLEVNETTNYTLEDLSNDTNLIREGLQRLESIDNANPSEDLKTIDEIRAKHTKYHTNGIASGTIEMEQEYFVSLIHIAKSNIEKLERIEEAQKNSSNEQALDCLQTLKIIHHLNAQVFPKSYEYCNIIKDALTYKSKKELAFDIIKEKNVDILLIKNKGNVNQYNEYIEDENDRLTQEEFNLLKRYCNE